MIPLYQIESDAPDDVFERAEAALDELGVNCTFVRDDEDRERITLTITSPHAQIEIRQSDDILNDADEQADMRAEAERIYRE